MSESHGGPQTPADVRADIVATRAELGETVNQLAAKLDVKTRAEHGWRQLRSRAGDAAERARRDAPEPVRHALNRAGELGPVLLERARPYRTQLLAAAAALGLLMIVRRRHRPDAPS